MAIPEHDTPFHEKDHLERTFDTVLKNTTNGQLAQSDLSKITVAAQVQFGIDLYRAKAKGMTVEEIQNESHDSALLGRHLEEAGKLRPSRVHAHALVAGKHKYAAQLRLVMAILKIRIDDADNGCWLPENTAATPHPSFPNAPPHSRIHRYNYFFWIFARLNTIRNEDLFRTNLQIIAGLLQQGKLPKYVMLPKGVGLPNGVRL